MVRILVCAVLLSLAATGPGVVAAQEATPLASPATGECVAPELPPGTPSPPGASPAVEAQATGAATGTLPPTPTPVGTPADPPTVARVVAAEENLNACFNAANDRAVVALFTPNKLRQLFGTANPYDALAAMEAEGDIPPLELLAAENVEVVADARIRVEVVLRFGDDILHEADYWVERDGYLALDWTEELPPWAGTPTP